MKRCKEYESRYADLEAEHKNVLSERDKLLVGQVFKHRDLLYMYIWLQGLGFWDDVSTGSNEGIAVGE